IVHKYRFSACDQTLCLQRSFRGYTVSFTDKFIGDTEPRLTEILAEQSSDAGHGLSNANRQISNGIISADPNHLGRKSMQHACSDDSGLRATRRRRVHDHVGLEPLSDHLANGLDEPTRAERSRCAEWNPIGSSAIANETFHGRLRCRFAL